MPDNQLSLGKYTSIFGRPAKSRLHVVPSLRPPVHIFVDTKAGVKNYDWAALAAWTAKRNKRFNEPNLSDYIVNDVSITAHIDCKLEHLPMLKNI